MSVSHLFKDLATAYPFLGNPEGGCDYRNGSQSLVLFPNDELVVKCTPWFSTRRYVDEGRLLELLQQWTNVPCLKIPRLYEDIRIGEAAPFRSLICMERVLGDKIPAEDLAGEHVGVHFGQSLGRLHTVLTAVGNRTPIFNGVSSYEGGLLNWSLHVTEYLHECDPDLCAKFKKVIAAMNNRPKVPVAVHGDIKSDNFLVRPNGVCFFDFGLSRLGFPEADLTKVELSETSFAHIQRGYRKETGVTLDPGLIASAKFILDTSILWREEPLGNAAMAHLRDAFTRPDEIFGPHIPYGLEK